MSALPGADFSTNEGQNFAIRKVLHMLEYGILYLTFHRALKKNIIAFVLTVIFAASDEFHQTFVPGRTGKVQDLLIDTAGAGIMSLFIWKYYQYLPIKLKNWLEE